MAWGDIPFSDAFSHISNFCAHRVRFIWFSLCTFAYCSHGLPFCQPHSSWEFRLFFIYSDDVFIFLIFPCLLFFLLPIFISTFPFLFHVTCSCVFPIVPASWFDRTIFFILFALGLLLAIAGSVHFRLLRSNSGIRRIGAFRLGLHRVFWICHWLYRESQAWQVIWWLMCDH